MDVERVRKAEGAVGASDGIVRSCAGMTRDEASVAIAIALGRVCADNVRRLEKAIAIAELAGDPDLDREVAEA